jgi:hypothetical protein
MPLKRMLDDAETLIPKRYLFSWLLMKEWSPISDCGCLRKRNKQPSSSFSARLFERTLTLISFAAPRSIGR